MFGLNITPQESTLIVGLLALLGSLLGVVITLIWRARIDFELKAADIVLSSRYPRMAKRKAEILQSLFPKRLPQNFSEQFDASNFPGTLKYEMTLELFKAISSKLTEKEQIQEAWLELFPEVNWKVTTITDTRNDDSLSQSNSSGATSCSSG